MDTADATAFADGAATVLDSETFAAGFGFAAVCFEGCTRQSRACCCAGAVDAVARGRGAAGPGAVMPTSAWATPAPETSPAPTPSVTAPAAIQR